MSVQRHTVNVNERLQTARLAAAVASGGISGDPIYRTILRQIRDLELYGRLLDFGAGKGLLVRQICEAGFSGELVAADILVRPGGLPDSIGWLQSDLNYGTNIPDNSFDIVVSSEVIEHLENPRSVFRELCRIMRPGGTLILSTPNQESLRAILALIFRGHFVAFLDGCYPAHITALLRKDIVRICGETGFGSPRFEYTNSGGVPKWPRVSWQQASFGFLKGRLFSDNVVVVVRKLEMSGAA